MKPPAGVTRALAGMTSSALLVAMLVWNGGVGLSAAKTDIRADADPMFSFVGLKTWAWHPDGAGDVRQAVSSNTDPAAIASRVDPIAVPAIERELGARGFTKIATRGRDAQPGEPLPDLYVHYYALATVQDSSQYMGQFIAPVPAWGLPPFSPSTTALEVYPTGTLIIDITSPSSGAIVWRGSAQRRIDLTKPYNERRQILERAVADLLKRFPPKPKK
jgi:hypothetical protein